MNLLTLETTEGDSLLPRLHYVSPTTAIRTISRWPSSSCRPGGPGKSVTLRMKFEVKLPRCSPEWATPAISSWRGNGFRSSPSMRRPARAGRATEGWNVHQYHGNSEFYSDFGIYSVKINVPEPIRWPRPDSRRSRPSSRTARRCINSTPTTCMISRWSASPDFVVCGGAVLFERRSRRTNQAVPRSRCTPSLKDRYLHAAKSALAKYAQWYGAYPYSTLSIVVPPKAATARAAWNIRRSITAFAGGGRQPGLRAGADRRA